MNVCFRTLRPAVLLLCLLWTSWGFADDLEGSRSRLQEIEQRLKRTSRNLEEKQKAESQLLADMRTVHKEISEMQRRSRAFERELAEIERQKKEQEQLANSARKKVDALLEQVRERLVALYKFGDSGPLRVLFSSTTPAQMAQQFRYLSRVVRHDRDLLEEFRRRVGALDLALAELKSLQISRQKLLGEVQRSRKELESADALKRKLLAKVRKDRDALAAVVTDLKDRKERLQELIKKLETASGGGYSEKSGLFSGQKGRLPWPLKGRVLVRFGKQKHPELGTLYSSNGIEVEAETDSPIAAVGGGRVVFSAPFKGYGNLVILDHGDSYHTLYGHASRLKAQVGSTVKAGDVLAYAGYPGTEGVYFEIRHHGVPLDPLVWVTSRAH